MRKKSDSSGDDEHPILLETWDEEGESCQRLALDFDVSFVHFGCTKIALNLTMCIQNVAKGKVRNWK